MHVWIVQLMLLLQPQAPWIDTYADTARAIDVAAHEFPLFEGEDGPSRTAAELVAIAWYEAKFNPRAVADDGSGSVCLGQVDVRGLGVSAESLLESVDNCVEAMLVRIRESHRVCALRGRPPLERLGQYTGGGGACDRGLEAARRRAGLADWLVRRWPVRWVEDAQSRGEEMTRLVSPPVRITTGLHPHPLTP
jgi:hypothetical protein